MKEAQEKCEQEQKQVGVLINLSSQTTWDVDVNLLCICVRDNCLICQWLSSCDK